MNIYNLLKERFSLKKGQEAAIQTVDLPILSERTYVPHPPNPENIPRELVPIAVDGFLDTTNSENMQRYMNNLALLKKQAMEAGKVDNFMLIRNDDFLPVDWEWRVSSGDTGLEDSWFFLTQEIRQALAKKEAGIEEKSVLFAIPPSRDEEMKWLSKIDKDIGFVRMPVHYRSTKHFTINTPLAHTGEYNAVQTERNFNIIDRIDNFLASGYAYSAAYRDAYLDVSHESLPISQEAVVLIAEDKYQKILNQPEIAEQLKSRRVVVYRGDEGLAINMLLTEMGAFPSRPGARYVEIDGPTEQILADSLQNVCRAYSLGYDVSHAQHFTAIHDDQNQEYANAQIEFCQFLGAKFPKYADDMIGVDRYSPRLQELSHKIVREYGPESILAIIGEYNQMANSQLEIRKAQYKQDRASMTDDTKVIFRNTIAKIKEYYKSGKNRQLSVTEQGEIERFIKIFYHANTVKDQLVAAMHLNELLSMQSSIGDEDYHK